MINWIPFGSGSRAMIGKLTGTVSWSMLKGEQYKATFAGLRLKKSFDTVAEAQKAVEAAARKFLSEALVALGEK